MQSVFKFHIAATVLNAIDQESFIWIRKLNWISQIYSRIHGRRFVINMRKNAEVPLSEVIEYTVAKKVITTAVIFFSGYWEEPGLFKIHRFQGGTRFSDQI